MTDTEHNSGTSIFDNDEDAANTSLPYLTHRGLSLDELDEELKLATKGSKFRDNDSMATIYCSDDEEERHASLNEQEHDDVDDNTDECLIIPLQLTDDLDITMDGESSRRPLLSRSFAEDEDDSPDDGMLQQQMPSLDEADLCSMSVVASSLVSIPISTSNIPQNVIDHNATPKRHFTQPFFRRTNPVTAPKTATVSGSAVPTPAQARLLTSPFPTISKQQREGLFQSLSWDSRMTSAATATSPFRPRQPLHSAHRPVASLSPQRHRPVTSLSPKHHRPIASLSPHRQRHPQPPPPQMHSPQHRRDGSHNSAFMEWNTTPKNRSSSKHISNVFLLQSPQRMNFGSPTTQASAKQPQPPPEDPPLPDLNEEKETALHLVSSFVELGRALVREQDKENMEHTNNPSKVGLSLMEAQQAAESLRRASQVYAESVGGREDAAIDHETRCRVLDELVLSYSYAVEMKRATASASNWLSSIGWNVDASSSSSPPSSPTRSSTRGLNVPQSGTGSGSTSSRTLLSSKTRHGAPSEVGSTMAIAGEGSIHSPYSVSRGGDSTNLLAKLRTAKQQMQEKDVLMNKLNEELSKCRAEIGRLKATRVDEMTFKSPNRSILDDEEDEDSDNETSVCLNTPGLFLQSLAEISEAVIEEDNESEPTREPVDAAHGNAEQDDSYLRTTSAKGRNENHDQLQDDQLTPGCSTRMINVRMLDAENFITEWDDMTPLPPPPDHTLRAPIVHSLLEQWTSDKVMHESLFQWVDGILDCSVDLNHVPPLTISSLDHQVRDGFAMHVLPLLLRRADIHVDVKTRAHRRTTYDISVSVSKSYHASSSSASSHSHSGQSNATRYTGTDGSRANSVSLMTFKASSVRSVLDENDEDRLTSIVSNKTSDLGGSRRDHNSSFDNSDPTDFRPTYGGRDSFWNGTSASVRTSDDVSVESSVTGATCLRTPPRNMEERSVLMKAFGGALGGFLSRRNVVTGNSPHQNTSLRNQQLHGSWNDDYHYSQQNSPNTASSQRAVQNLGEDQRQPYHRVVSAPPGRIGIELVQYRGHAMVSHVSPESPLVGWIFPTDILIAIDEVPVSGLRVREIVKILTERASNRQRSLRIISSHAMAELTQGSGPLDMR